MKPLLRLSTLLLLLSIVGAGYAQTDIVRPNLSIPSRIGPAYFGPNAFPVPDMLDGRTSSQMRLEMYGDCFLGTTTASVSDDVTADLFAKLTIPLFTEKANLTLWMPIFEYFYTSSEINALRRLPYSGDLQGFDSGDAYVSADIRILSQERHHCDMAIRAVLKTASANRFAEGRCYDAPGYFFDVSAGRGFAINEGCGGEFRMAVSTGFLCWQTDNGRQNDAVMYGAQLAYRYNRFGVDTTLGGYVGWEGVGDRPMTLKTNISYTFGDWSLRLGHQVGFVDWPYHQIRLGVTWNFDILSKLNK